MNSKESGAEIMQLVVERLAKAKWIIGTSMARDDAFWVNLTELGRQKFDAAADTLIRLAPEAFKSGNLASLAAASIRQPSTVEFLLMQGRVMAALSDLQPPNFSSGESKAILGMVQMFALEKGSGQNPPGRS